MPTCEVCSSSLPEGARFCASCGSAADISDGATIARPVAARPASQTSASSGSIDHGRFLPGTMFGDRYRITGLLGKGGMGEVYKADDLKLGQTVALKLLPQQLAADEGRLSRLLNEVRTARQVAHPNVCRVYDIGETGNEHFITMEYVHGEDLAALLHRIGRLPRQKGIEIARQVCAGLAAAHDRGILHRDLKPANIMLDERGKVRITDFGLAGLTEALQANVREGTPAYMAPEQLANREVTVRSDIYSLGLVLYEIFTGRRAFEADSLADLVALRENSSVTSPSQISDDMDPAIERVIMRCLENEPRDRPPSALAVAAALPGGDPLAAALAAGETPSPELVAAAGESAGLSPSIGLPLVIATVIAAMVTVFVLSRTSLTARVSLDLPPDALALKAREIVAAAGYPDKPVDTAHGLNPDIDYLRWIENNDKTATRWERLSKNDPPAMGFWYRESPVPLVASGLFTPAVTQADPAPVRSNMANVRLTTSGSLIELTIVPPQVESTPAPATEPDWRSLFEKAGLDLSQFKPVPSTWTPRVYADRRFAWEGRYGSGEPLRIEAASYRGKPVYFQLIGPWTRATRMKEFAATAGENAAQVMLVTLLVILVAGAALLARRNVMSGRGDRRGAMRLALVVAIVAAFIGLLFASHVGTTAEVGIVIMRISWSLFMAALMWMLYLALEPFVRRRWPQALTSWSRVLSARLRDPLVGRDVLIGTAAGAGFSCAATLLSYGADVAGLTNSRPNIIWPVPLLGLRFMAGHALNMVLSAIFIGLATMFFLLIFRVITRRDWIAATVFVPIVASLGALQSDAPLVDLAINVFVWVCVIAILTRFGLLATVAAFYSSSVIVGFPVASSFGSWAAIPVWVGLIVIGTMTIASFYVSLAGRPMFRESLFDT